MRSEKKQIATKDAVNALDVQFWLSVPYDDAVWAQVKEVFFEDEVDEGEDAWIRIRDASKHVKKFVTSYLAQEHLSVQGGFMIWTEGKLWNNYFVDKVSMTMNWFHALETLLLNQQKAVNTWVWEESDLVLQRDEMRLLMYEDLDWREDFCPPVIVSLLDLSRQMVAEGLAFVEWVQAIHTEITSLHSKDTLQQVNLARRERLSPGRSITTAKNTTTALKNPPAFSDIEKLGMILKSLPISFIETIQRVAKLVK